MLPLSKNQPRPTKLTMTAKKAKIQNKATAPKAEIAQNNAASKKVPRTPQKAAPAQKAENSKLLFQRFNLVQRISLW